jgi:hypothetical protein
VPFRWFDWCPGQEDAPTQGAQRPYGGHAPSFFPRGKPNPPEIVLLGVALDVPASLLTTSRKAETAFPQILPDRRLSWWYGEPIFLVHCFFLLLGGHLYLPFPSVESTLTLTLLKISAHCRAVHTLFWLWNTPCSHCNPLACRGASPEQGKSARCRVASKRGVQVKRIAKTDYSRPSGKAQVIHPRDESPGREGGGSVWALLMAAEADLTTGRKAGIPRTLVLLHWEAGSSSHMRKQYQQTSNQQPDGRSGTP